MEEKQGDGHIYANSVWIQTSIDGTEWLLLLQKIVLKSTCETDYIIPAAWEDIQHALENMRWKK